MIIIKCVACGYKKSIEEDYGIEDTCPLCSSRMEVINKEELIEQVVKDHAESKMKECIVRMGHKKVWKTIEGLSNPKTRIRFRKIFFDCEGEFQEYE